MSHDASIGLIAFGFFAAATPTLMISGRAAWTAASESLRGRLSRRNDDDLDTDTSALRGGGGNATAVAVLGSAVPLSEASSSPRETR